MRTLFHGSRIEVRYPEISFHIAKALAALRFERSYATDGKAK